ncbi:MAG: FAD-dependent monooxygenase [Bacteroidota bacterium]
MQHSPILIIGGGIGGLCTAIALRKLNLPVLVCERVPVLKGLGAGLVLAQNAMKAFQALDIDHLVQERGYAVKGFHILDQRGRVLGKNILPDAKQAHTFPTVTIDRGILHELLMSLLPPEIILTGKSCQQIEDTGTGVQVHFEDGTGLEGQALIGADGIHSVVRRHLFPETPLRYGGYTCWRGIVQLPEGSFTQELVTETWGAQGRFGIVPLGNDRVYWFATKNAPQDDPVMAAFDLRAMQQNYQGYHDPIQQVLAAEPEKGILWNDILDFRPLKHFAKGKALLLGDAAHATTPNMGQGACMAIEDAVVLRDCFAQYAEVPTAFQAFEKVRQNRTRRIVNQSYQIGRIAQLTHPVSVGLRNTLLRMTPPSLSQKSVEKTLDISFPVQV